MMIARWLTVVPIIVFVSGCSTLENPFGTDAQGAGTEVTQTVAEDKAGEANKTDAGEESGISDQTVTKAQAAAAGAAIGAVAGALLGKTRGAIIGALAGAGLGYIAGNVVAKRKAEYASEEDFLDAEIAQADALNKEAAAYNAELQKNIASLDTESKKLVARYEAGTLSRDKVAAEHSTVRKQLDANKKLEENMRSEYKVKTAILEEQKQRREGTDPYIVSLEKQVRELQENIDTLHKGSTQLAEIDERLSI